MFSRSIRLSPAVFGYTGSRCAVGLMTALLACRPNDPAGGEAPFVDVSIQNAAFRPKEITITVGQTVRWTNEDPVFHTVTSGNPGDADAGALFDSNDLIPYDNFTFQFNTTGEFVYFSTLDIGRPGMVGAKVTVTE